MLKYDGKSCKLYTKNNAKSSFVYVIIISFINLVINGFFLYDNLKYELSIIKPIVLFIIIQSIILLSTIIDLLPKKPILEFDENGITLYSTDFCNWKDIEKFDIISEKKTGSFPKIIINNNIELEFYDCDVDFRKLKRLLNKFYKNANKKI